MDFEPRQLDGHLLEILSSLAELVMREIEQDLAANLIPGACAPQWAKPSAAKTLTTPTSTLDPAALASTGSLLSTSPYNRGAALQDCSATLACAFVVLCRCMLPNILHLENPICQAGVHEPYRDIALWDCSAALACIPSAFEKCLTFS